VDWNQGIVITGWGYFSGRLCNKKNNYNHASEEELDCVEVIMNEKERFGRVRNSMMKTLRKKYGRETADRA